MGATAFGVRPFIAAFPIFSWPEAACCEKMGEMVKAAINGRTPKPDAIFPTHLSLPTFSKSPTAVPSLGVVTKCRPFVSVTFGLKAKAALPTLVPRTVS
jgi:hypothetical protein